MHDYTARLQCATLGLANLDGAVAGSGGKGRSAMTVTHSTPGGPGRPPADALYDARRGVYYTKPVLRGWLHLLWFEASLVLGTLVLARPHAAPPLTPLPIYPASPSPIFRITALYHRGTWTDSWRRRLQRLDHAMIFFLIAG